MNFKRWHEDLIRGSEITASVYGRRLVAFCEDNKTTPEALAQMVPKDIENLLRDYIHALEEKGHAPGYLGSIIKAVRSWAAWNDKPLQRKIKIANRESTPTLENEVVPAREELKRVLNNDKTPLRTRACIVLVAFAGLRLQTLGDYLGKDGLKIKDLPELEYEDKLAFKKTPAIIHVRINLSKAGHAYITFLADEGCKIIIELLERRRQGGENLTPETPIIGTGVYNDSRGRHYPAKGSKHLYTVKVGESMRQAIRACEYPWRPYVFRSYFDSGLMLAESKRFVLRDYRQFWMGHKGDIEATYTTRKGRLSEEMVEDMREAYRKGSEFLVTTGAEASNEEKMRRIFNERLLIAVGFKGEELEQMNLSEITDEELHRIMRGRLLGVMTNNGSKHKVILNSEVENYLSRGWEFVSPLGTDRAVLRIPST